MRFPNYSLAAALLFSLPFTTACPSAKSAAAVPPPHATAPALTAANSSTPPAQDDKSRQVEAVPAAPKPDPVAALITDVEKEFQSGQDNLKAGNSDAARHNFDR